MQTRSAQTVQYLPPAKLFLAVIGHVYRMGFVNIGLQTGFAIDIFPKAANRILFGGSIMFSDGRHRVSVNAGIIYGKVQRLSAIHQVGDFLEGADANLELVEKSKSSWYLGLTYNIPINRQNVQKME